jgi:hypothetical protein
MKLTEIIKSDTPEVAVEYFRKGHEKYDPQSRSNLMVKLSQLSLLQTKTYTLKDFYDLRKDSKLIGQFVRATFLLAREYDILKNKKEDFESFQYVVDNLFGMSKRKNDITFYMEPGFDFKGVFKTNRFSISKMEHDKEEASRGSWAAKEREELRKIDA